MNFQDLHELLRLELLRRIGLGSLSGSALARQAGYRQGHMSNFLNGKRSLSMEGLDRVLAAQNLTVEQILPLQFSAGSPPPAADIVEAVPVISPSAAMDDAVIRGAAVVETVHVSASQLRDHRPRVSGRFVDWQRFVAIRGDPHQTAAMEPVIAPGSILVLDRHYNSLAPYRAHERTLYAVRCGAGLLIRYLEFDDGRLILRPLSNAFPVQLLSLGSHETPADYIVGRVCLVVSEL